MFVRNVRSYKSHTASQPRRRHLPCTSINNVSTVTTVYVTMRLRHVKDALGTASVELKFRGQNPVGHIQFGNHLLLPFFRGVQIYAVSQRQLLRQLRIAGSTLEFARRKCSISWWFYIDQGVWTMLACRIFNSIEFLEARYSRKG
jgi:hypothetical protein